MHSFCARLINFVNPFPWPPDCMSLREIFSYTSWTLEPVLGEHLRHMACHHSSFSCYSVCCQHRTIQWPRTLLLLRIPAGAGSYGVPTQVWSSDPQLHNQGGMAQCLLMFYTGLLAIICTYDTINATCLPAKM